MKKEDLNKLKKLSLDNNIKLFKNNWVLRDRRTILKECNNIKKTCRNEKHIENINTIINIIDSDNYIEIYEN